MKGAAMKVGQVMSFLDVGLVPEEYREDFQRSSQSCATRPRGHLHGHARVIESEFGTRSIEVFDEFDTEPVAAASIGQVYRARSPTAARSPSRSNTPASQAPSARTSRTSG